MNLQENNHEIYRICQNCGKETDVRKSIYCDNCGEKVKLFKGCVLFTLFSSAALVISFLLWVFNFTEFNWWFLAIFFGAIIATIVLSTFVKDESFKDCDIIDEIIDIDGYMHRFMPDSDKWTNRMEHYHKIWGVEKIGNILLT